LVTDWLYDAPSLAPTFSVPSPMMETVRDWNVWFRVTQGSFPPNTGDALGQSERRGPVGGLGDRGETGYFQLLATPLEGNMPTLSVLKYVSSQSKLLTGLCRNPLTWTHVCLNFCLGVLLMFGNTRHRLHVVDPRSGQTRLWLLWTKSTPLIELVRVIRPPPRRRG